MLIIQNIVPSNKTEQCAVLSSPKKSQYRHLSSTKTHFLRTLKGHKVLAHCVGDDNSFPVILTGSYTCQTNVSFSDKLHTNKISY